VTGVSVRLLTLDDVPELAALTIANREHLAPTSPTTDGDAFTEPGVRAQVEDALGKHGLGLAHPMLIVDGSAIVGRINLNSIVRGAAQSASVGYWVAQVHTGRGVATAALAAALVVGFDELGLHRVQGETLPGNRASQVVLERNGFERFGYAPAFLRIAGQWQDHVLYQRINGSWSPPA
jgi:ribosomal-protein-alanine N-acetyltransferase